jgi:predicted CxxxxCH...CXXCH cytochrome family protein
MRLAGHAALALLATSLVAACGTARDVDPDRIGAAGGGAHAVPFVDQHAAVALSGPASCSPCHGPDYDGGFAQSCSDCHETEVGVGYGDWATNCTFCHGARGAGIAAVDERAAPQDGPHQAHLVAGTFSPPLACSSCHPVPARTAPGSLGHVDGSVDVEFSTTARKDVASPGYAGGGGACAVYCHGVTAVLGKTASPAWTSTAALTCDGCHPSAPTSGRHEDHRVAGVACARCHPGYAVGASPTVDLAKHVNGRLEASPVTITATFSAWPADCAACHPGMHAVPFLGQHDTAALAAIGSCTECHGPDYGGADAQSCTQCHDDDLGFPDWATNCSFCHGTRTAGLAGAPGALAAPPQTAAGTGDQTSANPKVGAHAAHLGAGTFSSPLPCSSCHAVPARTFPASLDHLDGSADVEFSTTARKDVTSPAYAGDGGACAVYCHGVTALLGKTASPAWTSTAALTCSSCHSAAPTSGEHGSHDGVACSRCHPGYAVGASPTVDLAKHVNGTFDASPVTTTATFSAWPAGCGACHPGMHAVPFLGQHATAALAGIASCTSCHGTGYGGGMGQSCTACHAAGPLGFADWRTNCSFCHGTRTPGLTGAPGTLAAPPQTVAGTGVQTPANPKVGAHAAHLAGGVFSNPLPCSSCHAVPAQTFPASLDHLDGSVDVEFSTTAEKNVNSPGYAGGGGTCAVYCHGVTDVLGNDASPAWTSTADDLNCNSCHSAAPTSWKHSRHRSEGVACADCHPGYGTGSWPSVDLAKHVNGTVDFVGASVCNGCH